MEAKTKVLSECEEMVMAIVWDTKEAPDLAETRKRVNEKFNKTWKPQTVSTFLTRLVQKGFLKSCRNGRYVYYEPAVSKDTYCAAEITRIAELYFKGDVEKFAHFVRAMERYKNYLSELRKTVGEMNGGNK